MTDTSCSTTHFDAKGEPIPCPGSHATTAAERIAELKARVERAESQAVVDFASLKSVCNALAERFPSAETMGATEAIHHVAERLEKAEAAVERVREWLKWSEGIAHENVLMAMKMHTQVRKALDGAS